MENSVKAVLMILLVLVGFLGGYTIYLINDRHDWKDLSDSYQQLWANCELEKQQSYDLFNGETVKRGDSYLI